MSGKLTNIGNLPKVLKVFASKINGAETEFLEYKTAREVENVAKDKECEELHCTWDPSTDRGFLVGFGFVNPESVGILISGKDKLITLRIHFTELSTDDFKRYTKLLAKHRHEQQEDMIRRKILAEQTRRPRRQ